MAHLPLRPVRLPSRREAVTLLLAAPAWARAALSDVIAAAKPSICAVGMFSPLESPRFAFRGTGFFVGDGLTVATCWHVLPTEPRDPNRTNRLVVQLPQAGGGFEYLDAEPVTTDRSRDLALLRVKGAPRPALAIADPARVKEGMSVALIGFPIGGMLAFAPVTHRGIVSSIVTSALPTPTAQRLTEGNVKRLREGTFEVLQLDATAYPGNSGGPLLDAESGAVVGIMSMVLVKGGREAALSHPSGISYAVPARYLAELMAQR